MVMFTAKQADRVGAHKNTRLQHGFTIVELMIALSILAVILVTASALMVRLGSSYTKGVNMANLQSVNRNIVADITSSIQFSGPNPAGCTHDVDITCATDVQSNVYAYCIGTDRYSYVMNRKLGTDSDGTTTPHVLWRDTMKNTDSCQPVDILRTTSDSLSVDGSGYEMLGANMRLTRFRIQETPTSSGIYTMQVWMAYGDSDLLNIANDGSPTCKGSAGTQFCALSKITTTVAKRTN